MPNNEFCFAEEDFVEYRSSTNDATRYFRAYTITRDKINGQLGTEAATNSDDGSITWKSVESVERDDFIPNCEKKLRMFDSPLCILEHRDSTDMHESGDLEYNEFFWIFGPNQSTRTWVS